MWYIDVLLHTFLYQEKFIFILKVAKEGATGAIFVFSFVDRSSFEEVDHQLSRLAHPNATVCPIVIGMK